MFHHDEYSTTTLLTGEVSEQSESGGALLGLTSAEKMNH
jgi:hypothetical protein